jgi:hypothetical protein
MKAGLKLADSRSVHFLLSPKSLFIIIYAGEGAIILYIFARDCYNKLYSVNCRPRPECAPERGNVPGKDGFD